MVHEIADTHTQNKRHRRTPRQRASFQNTVRSAVPRPASAPPTNRAPTSKPPHRVRRSAPGSAHSGALELEPFPPHLVSFTWVSAGRALCNPVSLFVAGKRRVVGSPDLTLNFDCARWREARLKSTDRSRRGSRVRICSLPLQYPAARQGRPTVSKRPTR